jgi:uncharacterized protein YcfJ
MFLTNRKNLAIGLGVLVLAGIGTAAWMHQSGSPPVAAPAIALDANRAPVAATSLPADYNGANGDGYYSSVPRPVYIRQPESVPPEPVYEAPVQTRYADGGRETYRTRRQVRHGRSRKHSVEIVAGTAAAGAAIGAIAGGGKGAALGGISGAGAGFVYDRLTHDH